MEYREQPKCGFCLPSRSQMHHVKKDVNFLPGLLHELHHGAHIMRESFQEVCHDANIILCAWEAGEKWNTYRRLSVNHAQNCVLASLAHCGVG